MYDQVPESGFRLMNVLIVHGKPSIDACRVLDKKGTCPDLKTYTITVHNCVGHKSRVHIKHFTPAAKVNAAWEQQLSLLLYASHLHSDACQRLALGSYVAKHITQSCPTTETAAVSLEATYDSCIVLNHGHSQQVSPEARNDGVR